MLGKRYFQKVAPYCDDYDLAFSFTLLVIIIVGYATFVETISVAGVRAAWTEFIKNSGIITLLTGWTAIIGLYRLRHRHEKKRPAVREDFNNRNGEGETDFGLRNFGLGPALYFQAIVTIEKDGELVDQIDPLRIQAHDDPIHLHEGEFASLTRGNSGIGNMVGEYLDQSDQDIEEHENTPKVNLYYSYVSPTGSREPPHISSNRDDEDVLDKFEIPDSEARSIELSRLDKAF